MYQPTLFRDRERPAQIVLGGVIPAIAGAIAGVLVGVSSGAYWGYAAFIAIATIVGGFEHEDGWGGADRGVAAGLIYGIALLLAHLIAGTHAKVSLGQLSAAAGRCNRDRRHAAERLRRLDGASAARARAGPRERDDPVSAPRERP